MIQKNPVPHPEWIFAYETFKNHSYGAIITYNELNKCITRGDVRTDRRSIITKLRKEMLYGQQKFLQNVPKIGYRIIKPNEHSNIGIN